MKRHPWAFAFWLLVLALVAATEARPADEDLFALAKSAAWAIYSRGTGKLEAKCSATAVRTEQGKTWLISAAHCFEDDEAEVVVTQNHLDFRGARPVALGKRKVNGALKGDDWAIVLVEVGPVSVIPLGDSRPLRLGEDVLMVGLPFGMDFLAVRGIVGSTRISLPGMKWNGYLGFNLFGATGNSGTGIVHIRQRAVVAILVAGPGEQSSMVVGTPIHLIPADAFK